MLPFLRGLYYREDGIDYTNEKSRTISARMDSIGDLSKTLISTVKYVDSYDDNNQNISGTYFSRDVTDIFNSQDESVNDQLKCCHFDAAENAVKSIMRPGEPRDIDLDQTQLNKWKPDHISRTSSFHGNEYNVSVTPSECDCNTDQSKGIVHSNITGSSCSSPPFTPPYSDASLGLTLMVPNILYDDCSAYSSGIVVSSYPSSFRPTLGDWEVLGEPTEISCISGVDGSQQFRVSYSAILNKKHDVVVNIGDAILLRRPTQEWFDRWPLTMKIISISYYSSNDKFSDGHLYVKMHRHFGMFQVSCMLPNIALEMANREAVVFSSKDIAENLTADCVFVGRCLILSLSEYYRFWAEVTRLQHGRIRRRAMMETPIHEEWQDWVDRLKYVYVLCGEYDPSSRALDSFSDSTL